MTSQRRGQFPLLAVGLIVILGGFMVYLIGDPVDVAAGAALGVLGLWLSLKGLRMLPPMLVSAVFLGLGLFFVVEGGNLLWSMGLASTPQAQQSYGLPFMAITMPWYIAGDLGIFFVILGAAMMFVAGLGFGRKAVRR
jgi:hypothetical protein